MAEHLSGFEALVLIVLTIFTVFPLGAVVWSMLTVNLRLAEQNHNQQKAILVLTNNPAAMALARDMEAGDQKPKARAERTPIRPFAGQ